MDLGVEREPTIAQSLDQVEFPEGPVAIQQIGVEARDHAFELAVVTRRGQHGVADVVVDVEPVVLDQRRLQRPVEQQAPVERIAWRDLLQFIQHPAQPCRTLALRQPEYLQAANVLGTVRGLRDQKAGIDGGESVHGLFMHRRQHRMYPISGNRGAAVNGAVVPA